MDISGQLELVLAHMRHGIVMYDRDETIRIINPEVGRIFGFADAAVPVGSTLSGYLRNVGIAVGWPDDRILRVLANHRLWAREARYRTFDHHFDDGRIFEIAFHPVDGGGALLTFVDATDERGLQAQKVQRDALGLQAHAMLERLGKIASHTRLVALNASIEASRSGAAGRGFGVVANEVRDLSRETSDVLEETRRVVAASLQLA